MIHPSNLADRHLFKYVHVLYMHVAQPVKKSACNTGDPGSMPGSGRSSGGGNDKPLQCSCLENPTDRGAWLSTVCGVAKNWTRLSERHEFDPWAGKIPWIRKWQAAPVFLPGKS